MKVKIQDLLDNWLTAKVNLNRNNGMFVASNIELKFCSLHFNNTIDEFHVKYGNVTYGLHDITINKPSSTDTK